MSSIRSIRSNPGASRCIQVHPGVIHPQSHPQSQLPQIVTICPAWAVVIARYRIRVPVMRVFGVFRVGMVFAYVRVRRNGALINGSNGHEPISH